MTNNELNNTLDDIEDGLTPLRETQLDEQEIDNLLVEEGINEDHYSSISDIANPNAIDDIDDIN